MHKFDDYKEFPSAEGGFSDVRGKELSQYEQFPDGSAR
jgi:hypothetical protein